MLHINRSKNLIVDKVHFSVRRCLFNIFGRRLQYHCFVTVSGKEVPISLHNNGICPVSWEQSYYPVVDYFRIRLRPVMFCPYKIKCKLYVIFFEYSSNNIAWHTDINKRPRKTLFQTTVYYFILYSRSKMEIKTKSSNLWQHCTAWHIYKQNCINLRDLCINGRAQQYISFPLYTQMDNKVQMISELD